MSKSPMARLLDGVDWKCTVCGQSNCDCWVKLRCLTCGHFTSFIRDEITPDLAVEQVSAQCPKCSGEGFDSSSQYLDANGKDVT